MSKGENDPRAKREASPSPTADAREKAMNEPVTATNPDGIPPLHVLEAAHEQERKETEDLLAGFDRPRRARRARAQRPVVVLRSRRRIVRRTSRRWSSRARRRGWRRSCRGRSRAP